MDSQRDHITSSSLLVNYTVNLPYSALLLRFFIFEVFVDFAQKTKIMPSNNFA